MFRAVAKAPLLAEAGLQALCPSLNSPVINIDELPIGPARAAIAVYAEEYGDLRVAVALRSLSEGDAVCFVFSGVGDEFSSARQALDTALSFAEGMGFLIDDDWVVQQSRGAAMSLWVEISAAPGEEIAAEPPSIDPIDAPAELELEKLALRRPGSLTAIEDLLHDDEAALELDQQVPDPTAGRDAYFAADLAADLELDAPGVRSEAALELDADEFGSIRALELDTPAVRPDASAPALAHRGAARAAPTLTKFRGADKPTAPKVREAAARDAANSANPLGRIALVRKRLAGGPEPVEKRSLLLRLLGQF